MPDPPKDVHNSSQEVQDDLLEAQSIHDDLEESIKLIFEDSNRQFGGLSGDTKLAEKEALNWGSTEELETKRLYFEIERYREDTQHRRTLSIWAGIVVSFWLLAVILILVGNTYSYKLSDSVLIALLGTTTLNVIALMLVVLNDIFNKGKQN